ncbi:hypothetical protein A33M_2589 [Rhodovulum sp. PH10]|nr:hypothetical protein A33M_2589 [Rhodovulum sp. PH10]
MRDAIEAWVAEARALGRAVPPRNTSPLFPSRVEDRLAA